jgi:hypothetical protein
MIPKLRNPRVGQHAASGLIRHDEEGAWEQLNEQPFAFRHGLADHPLLSIERLARLSERAFDGDHYKRYFKSCDLKLPRDTLKARFREDIEQIRENGKWMALHYIDEMDPEYGDLFDLLLADVEEITRRPVRSQMTWGSLSVFLSAPCLAVPYHFDHETNFLMQVQGEKDLWLYPREFGALTAAEIEDFYRHNPVAGIYRDGRLQRLETQARHRCSSSASCTAPHPERQERVGEPGSLLRNARDGRARARLPGELLHAQAGPASARTG